MKKFVFAAALALAALPAFSQHTGHGTTKPSATAAATEYVDGEVRRVDKARGTVLLKHGELKNLNMGAMTMSFRLKDPAMAGQLKEGDKIQFTAEQQGSELVVTSIRKAS